MRIKLPDNPDIEKEINRVLRTIDDSLRQKGIVEITGIGTEPTKNLEDTELAFVNESGTRKLVLRHQGRNYDVDLTERTT